VGCAAWADDGERSKGHARAEKRCAREAEDRGLRVEKVGEADRVGKKQYEVKLRVDRDYDRRDYRGRNKRDRDDIRVMCHYDDRSRRAQLL
jgi:hypothetical protein